MMEVGAVERRVDAFLAKLRDLLPPDRVVTERHHGRWHTEYDYFWADVDVSIDDEHAATVIITARGYTIDLAHTPYASRMVQALDTTCWDPDRIA